MLFLSDLSRQRCTKYTGQQGFDVPDSPTGHGEERKDFRRQQTQMEDNQKTRLVVGTSKDIALLRVRGDGQHNTTREVTLDEDRHEYRTAHVRGMTSTPQFAM